MAFYGADFAIEFATGRLLYILSHSRMTYSAMKNENEKLFYRDIFLKSIPEKGVVKLMTDNLKEKTHKTVDNTCMNAGTVKDAKVNIPTIHNDTGMKTQKVSDIVKIDAHKSVSDPKNALHDAGSKLNKATI
jgi:hypothetical protein